MTSMRCIFVLLAGLAAWFPVNAQQNALDRMSDQEFLSHLAIIRSPQVHATPLLASTTAGKCPFDLTSEIAHRLTTMSEPSRSELQRLIAPAAKDTSILSPSGRFRVEFDLSGPDEPALLIGDVGARIPNTAFQYAAQIAAFFDRAYDVEVTQLGYDKPPIEDTRTEYRVVIVNMVSDYGQTLPLRALQLPTAQPTWTSYIEIDNDFLGNYYSKGLQGAKVTAAHEFHHMIQLGSYGLWNDDRWMHEMTSTYFEDVVFDEVNDYLSYLKYFFQHPERSLYRWTDPNIDGYCSVLFPKMLERKFGPVLLQQVWERMKKDAPLLSFDNALRAAQPQSDLPSEICSFGRWNYFTGYHSPEDSVTHYPEAQTYPLMSFAAKLPISNSAGSFSGTVAPFAGQYVLFYRGSDTAAFSIMNTDLNSVLLKSTAQTGYSIQVRTDGYGSDFHPVGNGWGYKFTPNAINMLCLNVFSDSGTTGLDVTLAYPNPYDPRTDGLLRFSIPVRAEETKATFHIYSVCMELVAKAENVNVQPDAMYGRHIAWDGKTMDGNYPGSGVYFYVVSYGASTETGKIAIVNR